ncbi:hypothetical protein [Streptomyces yaizuensis]|uniref:Uncharacterized protein n=1 Tax=Streptomyces yaizuensis TaxID=2989713 RepID=A0AA86IVL8_9ACTN|nr:hypothetical protein [Streptomyces sp. YSPA8]BDT39525.1 hypothetical protein SYYSPA8_37035 [Streptomyces sp. YSPA8]
MAIQYDDGSKDAQAVPFVKSTLSCRTDRPAGPVRVRKHAADGTISDRAQVKQ